VRTEVLRRLTDLHDADRMRSSELLRFVLSWGLGRRPGDSKIQPSNKPDIKRDEGASLGPTSRHGKETDGLPSISALVDTEAFKDTAPGATIKIWGEWIGVDAEGHVKVHLAKPYYGHRPCIAATDLMKAYKTDRAAADKKYRDTTFVIVGVLSRIIDEHCLILSGSAAPGIPASPRAMNPDLRRAKPDVFFTANELFKEVKQDALATQRKYSGKVIELTGLVKEFPSEDSMRCYLQLEAGEDFQRSRLQERGG
jgi:hypothetical protein